MNISAAAFAKFSGRLRAIRTAASDDILSYISKTGVEKFAIAGYDMTSFIDYAYGVATKYGEASGALTCELYDAIAQLSGKPVPPAVMAPTPTRSEISKTVYGVAVKYYEPRLVFKVNVDYTSRNDLGFMMGVAAKPYSERPTAQVVSSIVYFQGGDYPMQGRGASSQIELALDATPIAIALDTLDKPKFFLRVDRKQIGKEGTGRLLGYEVHDYGTGRTYTFNEQCAPFEYGVNLYGLATTPLVTFSASRVDWLTREKEPVTSPLVVRTAKGKYAKIRITKKGDEISFKYVYAPDGSVHLGN